MARSTSLTALVLLAGALVTGCCTNRFLRNHVTGELRVEPDCLPTTGGSFTLHGENFPRERRLEVTLDGVSAHVIRVSEEKLFCRVAGSFEAGPEEIVVTVCPGRRDGGKERRVPIRIVEAPGIDTISIPGSPERNRGGVCGGYVAVIEGHGFVEEGLGVLVEPAMTPFFRSVQEVTDTTIRGFVASHVCWGEGPWTVEVSQWVPGCAEPLRARHTFTYDQDSCECEEVPALDADGGLARAVAIGDFDHDGRNDVVAGKQVYLGDGSGSFEVVPHYALPETAPREPYGLAAGDLDGDGEDDLVVAYGYALGVGVYLQEERELRPGPTGSFPSANRVRLADLDGDGDLDLAGGHRTEALWVRLGDGSGAFLPLPELGLATEILTTGSLSGTGPPDLFAVEESRLVRLRWNAAEETFDVTEAELPERWSVQDLAVLDLDVAASPVLALATAHGLVLYDDFPEDGEEPSWLLPLTAAGLVRGGHFSDRDVVAHIAVAGGTAEHGFLDLLLSPPHSLPGTILSFPLVLDELLGSGSLAVGDLNADGLDDVVVATGAGTPQILLGR